nr:hypothetical protein [Xanthomonas arboricola]MDN0207835.1 hypothetical protein [Xanthomonas arboricola pv. corylina]MDN0212332.1 hypothetical protein [Xanthomonas arboricola pv. corylina]
MRLVRYLFVLIVVLSTSAWAAPTQADLPIAWGQAALHTQPPTERDLRVGVAPCELTAQGAAARTCDTNLRQLVRPYRPGRLQPGPGLSVMGRARRWQHPSHRHRHARRVV